MNQDTSGTPNVKCGNSFSGLGNLKKHIREEHGAKINQGLLNSYNLDNFDICTIYTIKYSLCCNYHCEKCGIKFSPFEKLKKHLA